MKYMQIIFLTLLVFVCATVFGDEVAPASGAVVSALDKVLALIPADLPLWLKSLLGTVGFLIAEFVVRIVPSAKPRSFFLVFSYCFQLVASICTKISGLLDQVAQNLKDPDPK